MSLFQNKIISLMGPTASGKTDLALQLAEKLPLEIVSVDSALIYRNMDIGTAKPSQEERDQVPHHLIDILNPDQNYSVANFLKDAYQAIETIWQKNKLPLLVGGTMMYFHALRSGLSDIPAIDAAIRSQLLQHLESQGLPSLYQELLRHDPILAQRLSPQDSQRITRALEVFYGTGRPLSAWQSESAQATPQYQNLWLKLIPADRQALHENIAVRFQKMLAAGFIDEVIVLKERYVLDLNCSSLRCVGYRQAWQYLQNEIDYETMRERAIIATRQLAKRQLTWLRQWPDAALLTAFDAKNRASSEALIKQWVEN